MTTLIDTIRPTNAYLESILPQATTGRTEEKYVGDYLDGLIQCINNNPQIYRMYGPWWASLKTLIIERGDVSLGQIVESDVAAIYGMGRPALTVLAAHLYASDRLENGAVYSDVHLLDVASYADDTEPYVYTSYDESIEKYKIKET
jgi:hypothetical protein